MRATYILLQLWLTQAMMCSTYVPKQVHIENLTEHPEPRTHLRNSNATYTYNKSRTTNHDSSYPAISGKRECVNARSSSERLLVTDQLVSTELSTALARSS